MLYLQTKYYVQCPSDITRHTDSFISALLRGCASPVTLPWLLNGNGHLLPRTLLLPGRRGWRGWSLPTSIPIGPTIMNSIQRGLLLRRLFFINEDRTKYVCVGFYPARDYLPLVEFRVVWGGDGPKTLILGDEPMEALAEALPTLRGYMCSGETTVLVRTCESVASRLDLTRIRRTARL